MAFNTTTERPQLCSEQAGVPRQHTPMIWLEDPRSAFLMCLRKCKQYLPGP